MIQPNLINKSDTYSPAARVNINYLIVHQADRPHA